MFKPLSRKMLAAAGDAWMAFLRIRISRSKCSSSANPCRAILIAGANVLVAGSATFKGGPSQYKINMDAIRAAAAEGMNKAAA